MAATVLPCAVLLALSLLWTPALPAAEFVAPYVNSPQEDVELMLELAAVGPADYVIDLGSGDGRIPITAALRGGMARGVELDRELVELARRRAREAEVADLAAFERGDIFEADLSAASVVTVYLMPDVNLRLRPKLLAELTPGTRLLSNSFDMGEWLPDRHVKARTSGGILMWIVPAAIQGGWVIEAEGRQFVLDIDQSFQNFTATLASDGERLHVLQTALEGDHIALLAGDGQRRFAFRGRVDGARMTGVLHEHGTAETRTRTWRAARR